MTGPGHLSRQVSRRILAIPGPRIGGARGAISAPVELIRGRLPASEKGVRLDSRDGHAEAPGGPPSSEKGDDGGTADEAPAT